MSVSDQHGGGLTLQRVLGDDLDRFVRFVHPGRFGTDHPPAGAYRARALDLPLAIESDVARQRLGWRPSAWLANRPWLRRWWAAAAAVKLSACLRLEPRQTSRWLVCPQGDLSLRLVAAFRRRQPMEYVTWMMDDHLVRYDPKAGGWHYRSEHRALLGAHLRGARTVFVISPAMGEFYAREFGVESTVLFGPGEPTGEPVWDAPTPPGQPMRLGYFGGLGDWQRDALALLLPSVAAGAATLDVFTSQPLPGDWPTGAGLRRYDPLPSAAVPAAMRERDAVVLPISFLPGLAHMTRLNIATKMAECLSSGTLTLLIGPPEAAMTRYLQGTGTAGLVTEAVPDAVRVRLRELRVSAVRHAMLAAARAFCADHCSPAVMHAAWQRETADFLSV